MEYKAGIGYDIHRLVKGRKLFLGGIQIPHTKGLLGHSDADVLLHAVCDALLGAAGLADIGKHFPDTDKRYKNIRSTQLLKNVLKRIKRRGLEVVNLDATLVAEEPKMSVWRLNIQEQIAKQLGICKGSVNLKATTAEGLGDIGKKKAIAAWCVVLLRGERK